MAHKEITTKYRKIKVVAFQDIDGLYGYKDADTGITVIPATYTRACDFTEGRGAVAVIVDSKNRGSEATDAQPPEQYQLKWGFVKKSTKKIIPLIYDTVTPFKEGLAAVCIDGKWGYIDRFGNNVIPKIFDDAQPFNEGVAEVSIHGKKTWIDSSGYITLTFEQSVE